MNMEDNSRTLQEATDIHREFPGVSIRVYRSCRLLQHKHKCSFIIWIVKLEYMFQTGSSKVIGRYLYVFTHTVSYFMNFGMQHKRFCSLLIELWS